MTAVRACWFICDACDEASGPGGIGDFSTRAEAWAAARVDGWHERPEGRHICHGCWEQGER